MSRRLLATISLLLIALCAPASASKRRASAAPPVPAPGPSGSFLWAGLQPGPRLVAYKTALLRIEGEEFHHGPQHFIQASVWYPAQPGTGTPMTFRDYVLLKVTENTIEEPTEAARNATLAEFRRSLTDIGVSERTANAILDAPVFARRDALTPPRVLSPIVFIAPGIGRSAIDQAILAEYIASYGYVVVATPSVTRLTGPLTGDEQLGARLEQQAEDMDIAASMVGVMWPSAVNTPISVVGYDIGADAALLYSMHHPTVVIALLDPSLHAPAGLASLRAAPTFVHDAGLPPLLEIDSSDEPASTFMTTLNAKEFSTVTEPSMRHIHFTTLGFAAAVFPDVAKATGAGPNIKHDVVDFAQRTLQFLDRIWGPVRPPR
ncbi:MAG TPA: hypothetical protein VF980_09270 [Thermoanaerobaculia bacterium]